MSKRPLDALEPSSDEDEDEFFQAQLARAVKRQQLAQEPSISSEDESETDVCTKGKPLGITNEYGDWLSVHGFSPDKFRVSTKGYYQIHHKGEWTKASRGHLLGNGYRQLRIDRKVYNAHNLFCMAFFGVRPSELHTAQHGFGGGGDNSIDNLKGWATPKQQATEYRNPHKPHRNGKPILTWKVGTPKAEAEWHHSATAAIKATGAPALHMVVNGKIKQSGGFCAEWAPPPESQDDLPLEGYAPAQALTEEWRDVKSTLRVSNRGRVWYKNAKNNLWGYKYTLTPCARQDYAIIEIGGKNKRFHRIIYEAFFPGVAQERVIDHIDQDKTNNQLHNLRPLTHAQNCRNVTRKDRTQIKSSLKKAVRGRPINTSVWTLHKPSINEAAEAIATILRTEKRCAHLSEAIHKGRPYKGWQFEFV